MRFTCFSMLAIPNIQFQTWVNESYNAVKHEFAKVDFLIKSTHYLTKHRFSFPDDNSQIFNQFMLGGGQETEEGSKQSNFCDLLLKYLLSNFPWPSTSYTFQNILKIRRNWLLDENGSGIWQRTSWREKSDNISLRDRFSKMSAAEISVVATGIDLLHILWDNWNQQTTVVKAPLHRSSPKPFWRQILNGCLLNHIWF